MTSTKEEDYDPHKHRNVEKPTSYLDTMVHMIKGSCGAGVLAMPEAVKRVGIVTSILSLMFIGFFAAYCMQLLINTQYRLCKRHRQGYMAYPASMKQSLLEGPIKTRWIAPIVYYFVDGVLILWQLGICTVYFIFVAENIKQIMDFYSIEMTLRVHLTNVLIPAILINLVKDLKLMTPLSGISNLATMLGLILVFYYLLEDDLDFHTDMMYLKNFVDFPIFIGTALFALEAVGVVLALEYNMENPKQFVGICGLFNIGIAVILLLYLIVGLFGYIKYGSAIKASLTLNLPHEQKKAQSAKGIFAVAIFLSIPLQNFVAYEILWRKFNHKISGKKRCLADYALRVVLVIIPYLAAIAIPRLGPFISLMGAFCLSLLAVVFPAIMDVCVCYGEPKRYGRANIKLIRDMILLVIGLFCMCSGVYTSIIEIVTGDENTHPKPDNNSMLF
ncbi:proton-coupled amino acid transporter-like protein CG1139 isoform X2 [Hyposmocoma kahamanoa]|uniref:proton-coupled amino acid transporter-like protein CG1139 isoform X2 n=1 Tax=Hyposmocoma kahamanoa TaxID=1477025 RepID=UPI000E6D90FB|nr:proton-coupled amino acid transporter-like protein CG1139 isoform X2 [Hyposmocoma kahamanoa]